MRKFGRLREQIKEKFGTQKAFANKMGVNVATLNSKLNGKAVWSLKEIENVCELLDIPANKIGEYFFY